MTTETTTPASPTTVRLADGREFPFHGTEVLSWDLGSCGTRTDEREGHPRVRAVVRAMAAHRPDQLRRELSDLVRSSFDRMFGRSAARLLAVVEDEIDRLVRAAASGDPAPTA